MIPLIEREVVRNKWITQSDVADIVAVSQSIPGAVSVNMALFVGHRIARSKGALVSVLGCIAPSVIMILLIAAFFTRFQEYEVVQNIFVGVLCAVVALIIKSAYSMAKLAILDLPTLVITIVTVIGLLFFSEISPLFYITGGAAIGLLFYYVFPKKARAVVQHGGVDHD